jgi:2-C-methyl-D-erythritol 4-phosphate cytidylyltransferase
VNLKSKYHVVIPASGIGARFNSNIPKQYHRMQSGKTILDTTIEVFLHNGNFEHIVIVLHKNDNFFQDSLFANHPQIHTVVGGAERFLSVKNGIDYLATLVDGDDFIAVHDSVRPCVTHKDINNLLTHIDNHSIGGLLGVEVFDTLKKYQHRTIQTIDRVDMYHALTPQIYRLHILQNALQFVIEHKIDITDDASSIEALGKQGLLVQGSKHNIKITTPQDLELANLILNTYK